jgi:hypothetical protein
MSDRTPARPRDAERALAGASPAAEIDAFLRRAAHAPRPGAGRLIFALDATMSRQPTWDLACRLQGAMFDAAASVGGLSVQLVYFRGLGECAASTWAGDAGRLGAMMARIDCRGGHTQIGKVLAHARREAEAAPLAALVYVGDAMEEDADALCAKAGELALLGVRAFLFHEGRDAAAGACFREIARLTGGVCLPFDARAAAELKALLAAVGAWAAGGRRALEARDDAASARLLADLR